MRILHGTWIPNGFFVFVEENHQPLPADTWKQDVFRGDDMELLGNASEQNLGFQLPVWTAKGELKHPQPNPLPTQRVSGIVVPIRSMFTYLLLSTGDSRFQDDTMRTADDFLYWRRAGLFALELLMRGRVMPTVQAAPANVRGQRNAYSVWVPHLQIDSDKQRFLRFVNAMPPFCRSYHPDKEQGWLNIAPKDILMSFLTWGMDAWIRDSVTDRQRKLQLQVFDEADDQTRSTQAFQTTALRWMKGLLNPKGSVSFTSRKAEVERLARDVAVWTGGLDKQAATRGNVQVESAGHHEAARPGSLQLCFRLDTPASDVWELQFLLQSVDDPSLFIPADTVWQTRTADKVYLGWRFSGVQETLLAELGRASRLYPELEQTLNQPRPTHLTLDVSMAHYFLREVAVVLQAGGFVVLLPAWWTQKGRQRLGVKMRVKRPENKPLDTTGPSRFGLQQIVQFDACVAVGDDELSLSELEELAAQKVSLVQVRGMWTEVDPAHLQQVVDYLKAGGQGEVNLGTLMHLSAEGGELSPQLGSLPIVDFELPTDLCEFIEGRFQVRNREVPDALCGQLRPYQQRGFQWLAAMTEQGFGVCLADDMGLGKTVQIITLLLDGQHDSDARSDQGGQPKTRSHPALVLCPTSLVGNWQRELERFAPSLRVYVHHGANRPHALEFQQYAQTSDVVVSTYNLAYRDLADLSAIHWSHLVLDEAQNIKNSSSKQAQGVFRLQAQRRVAVTGTPVENRLDELWSLFRFLNAGYLGTAKDFRTGFALPVERDRNMAKAQALQKLVAPFILRRVKTDPTIIQDLPDKVEIKTYCPLTREQASLYEATVQDMLLQIEMSVGMQRKGLILASLTKLKQICNHPAQFLHDGGKLTGRSGKLARLMELLTQIREANEAVLIFTQYTEMGELLIKSISEELAEVALFLHGGVNKKRRDELVDSFQSDTGPGIFVLSLKAGGVGLNLTRANHVIHFDRWWNPAVENQASDRAFRIGQRRNVEVHKFICQGTLEDNIDTLIESKRELAEQVIGSGETWLSEMSNRELQSLMALRRDVLQEEEVG